MAKKEKNSGLGRGLDSLIPKIEEKEVEEGLSLEDILKQSEDEPQSEEPVPDENEINFDDEPNEDDKELVYEEEDLKQDNEIQVEEEDVEKYEHEIVEEEIDDEESSQYTNVFYNDDEKIDAKIESESSVKIIDSSVNINEDIEETNKIIEAEDNIKEEVSLLSEKEEKLVDDVIETVENNPRITLWSARSAAVLRYLRKTEPEFSISNEASKLIDAAIAEKYPEIWTLFNQL